MDNQFDMRVLRSYMQEIFTDGVMSGQTALAGMIKVAKSSDSSAFVQNISQLPEIDNPKIFGLPSNIDRSVQRFNSGQVIAQLKSLASVSASEIRFDKEKWTEALDPICQLWANIYKGDQTFADV